MPIILPLTVLFAATVVATGCSSIAARQGGSEPTVAPVAAVTPARSIAPAAPVTAELSGTAPTPSVAQIQSDIVQDPSMAVTVRRGWTMAKDTQGFVLWTFTPEKHPAHPSAIRRQVVNRDGAARIEMSVFCESSQTACDALVAQFKDKNRLIKNRLRAKHRMTNV